MIGTIEFLREYLENMSSNRLDGTYQSYWSQTGTYESILPLINKVLVGISYDKKEKTHQCSIKVYQKCKK